jgi:hypothetical protein
VTEKTLCPVYMIPEVFYLEFTNPEPKQTEYSASILDPDDHLFEGVGELLLLLDAKEAEGWLE